MNLDQSNFDNTGYEDCWTLNDFVRKIARRSLWIWNDVIEAGHYARKSLYDFEKEWEIDDDDIDFQPFVDGDLTIHVDNLILVPDGDTLKVFKCGINPFPSIEIKVEINVSLSSRNPTTLDISIGGISNDNVRGVNLQYPILRYDDNLEMSYMPHVEDLRKTGKRNIGKALADIRKLDLSRIFDPTPCDRCGKELPMFHLIEFDRDLFCSDCHEDLFNEMTEKYTSLDKSDDIKHSTCKSCGTTYMGFLWSCPRCFMDDMIYEE